MSSTSTYDTWAESMFVRWNNTLGGHFFQQGQAGQQVWLTASPTLLDEVGAAIGSDTQGLVTVLLAGPPWDSAPHELCRNARAAFSSWRARRRQPPPFPLYLSYLCLFAAAGATGDGAVRVNSYYPRLRELAKLPDTGTPKLFSQMTELWEDLERWTTADQHGTLGVFRATGVGQQRHIGLPLAQNLITPAERRALPGAYEAAGLRHSPMPTPAQLGDLLIRGNTRGLTRLQALLGPKTPDRDRELLLSLLSDSLRLWLEAPAQHPNPARPAPATVIPAQAAPAVLPERGRVALAARLDRAAGHLDVFLRLYLQSFPPVPVQLLMPAGVVLSCDEQASGWSTPLALATGGRMAAAGLDWLSGVTFTATVLGFQSVLSGEGLRVLQPGLLHGLPDLLETHELEAGQRAVLLVSDGCWPAVRTWCEGAASWQELPTSGLPGGWHLASAERCPDPAPLKPLLSWLPGPVPPTLLFDGGLRTGDGARHSYLNFARPTVRLAGGTGHETVTASALTLPSQPDGRHQLPPAVARGRHTVQAHLGDKVVAQAHILLASPTPPKTPPVTSPALPTPRWPGRRDLLLTPGLWQLHLHADRRAQQVTLLSRDGQAANWVSTNRPPNEPQVWAIPEGRNPQAVYVGSGEPSHEHPLPDRPSGAWLALLTGNDPRTGLVRPPAEQLLAGLWQQYEAAAARAYR